MGRTYDPNREWSRSNNYTKSENFKFGYNHDNYKKYTKRTKTAKSFKKAYSKFKKGDNYKSYKLGCLTTGAKRIFPLSAKTQLQYGTVTNIAMTSGVTTYPIIYHGNDMYDPQFTVGGIQPAGYDQLSALYRRWVVFGSTAKFTVFNTVSDRSCHAWLWGDRVDYNAYATTPTMETLWQNPQIQYKYVSMPNACGVQVLKQYRATQDFFPNKNIEDDENFWGTYNASPSTRWFWNFVVATDFISANVRVVVQIKYYAKWFLPFTEVLNES